MDGLSALNALPLAELRAAMLACCASSAFADAMCSGRPYLSVNALHAAAEQAWDACGDEDRMEAFRAHPRIGVHFEGKNGRFGRWSGEEQGGVHGVAKTVTGEMKALNDVYFDRFGFLFLICATGKSAEEILVTLKTRVENESKVEKEIAGKEQGKITGIRINKLLDEVGTSRSEL